MQELERIVFYRLTLLSFLECMTPAFVQNLARLYHDDPTLRSWLWNVWHTEEVEHGNWIRAYIRQTWPNFNWDAAYVDFATQFALRPQDAEHHSTPSLAALGRCGIEAQATAVYRGLAKLVDDARLRDLLNKIADDHQRHFQVFRRTFERYNKQENLSLWKRARTLLGRARKLQKVDLRIAFEAVHKHWDGSMPFAKLSTVEFQKRSTRALYESFAHEESRHMLSKFFDLEAWLPRQVYRYMSWRFMQRTV
jgi:hypothetical protein